jgi:hypothetical protein
MARLRTPSSVRGSALRRDRHVLQFQLGVLELERTRREQERQAARRKVEEIEIRLRQLDVQIRERQARLDRDPRGDEFMRERP